MAKIATITNPLTGQPVQVDQLEHTAQQIDDAIARALPGGAIDISLAKKVNPNLLDNPWFTVNQRGQTTYSTANAYTVDRWKFDDPYMTLDVNDDGTITLAETVDGDRDISQYFEDDILASLLNKTLTASILFQDGQLFSITFNVPSTVLTTWFNLDIPSKKMRIFMSPAYEKMRFSIRLYGIGSHAIKAVKLEVGSISTLASDTLPNYQQELAKCQRYFVRYLNNASTSANIGSGIAYDDTVFTCVLPLSVPMRAIPTFSMYGVNVSNERSIFTISNVAVKNMVANTVNLEITTSNLTTGYPYYIKLGGSGAYIDLSADL